MRVSSLEELAPTRTRAVVINVGTDVVATLAVLSAVRHVGPTLLVSCDPTERSRAHFSGLEAEVPELDVVEAPTLPHGRTLDALVDGLSDERLLLLDSDAEIRGDAVVGRLQAVLDDDPAAFGAGWTHGPFWLDERHHAPPTTVMYVERAWMPCVLLRAAPLRDAHAAGCTFEDRRIPNDLGAWARGGAFLAGRFGEPWGPPTRGYEHLPAAVRRRLAGRSLRGLRRFRRSYEGERPAIAYLDTGAEVFQHLVRERGMRFVGPSMELVDPVEVAHLDGVTRHEMADHLVGTVSQASVREQVVARLREGYDRDLEDAGLW